MQNFLSWPTITLLTVTIWRCLRSKNLTLVDESCYDTFLRFRTKETLAPGIPSRAPRQTRRCAWEERRWAATLPVYRCSPGVRGGSAARQAACVDPGCSQEGSGVTGSLVVLSFRAPSYATGLRPLQSPSLRKINLVFSCGGKHFSSRAAESPRGIFLTGQGATR